MRIRRVRIATRRPPNPLQPRTRLSLWTTKRRRRPAHLVASLFRSRSARRQSKRRPSPHPSLANPRGAHRLCRKNRLLLLLCRQRLPTKTTMQAKAKHRGRRWLLPLLLKMLMPMRNRRPPLLEAMATTTKMMKMMALKICSQRCTAYATIGEHTYADTCVDSKLTDQANAAGRSACLPVVDRVAICHAGRQAIRRPRATVSLKGQRLYATCLVIALD